MYVKRCRKPANTEVGRCLGAKKNQWIQFLRAYSNHHKLKNYGLALLDAKKLSAKYNKLKLTPGALDEYIRDYDGAVPGFEPNVPKKAINEEIVSPYYEHVRPLKDYTHYSNTGLDPFDYFLSKFSNVLDVKPSDINKNDAKILYDDFYKFALRISKSSLTPVYKELYDNKTFTAWLNTKNF